MNKDTTRQPEAANKAPKPKEQKVANLAAVVADDAVFALAKQRESLNFFIKTQLKDSVDFGVIPGTPKPTLLKPGAEKLANIFQLGSRIVNSDTRIEHDKRFIMCTYTIELFHLPSGKTLAQCEGSTNSLERRYQRQDPYSVLNTLQKMAQKRAFVGAVIQACNASDFFTQDLEDMDLNLKKDEPMRPAYANNSSNSATAPAGATTQPSLHADKDTIIKWGKYKGKTVEEAAEDDKFLSYCEWIIGQSEGKKDKQGFLNDARAWVEVVASLGAETEVVEEESGEETANNEDNQSHPEHRRVA